MKFPPVVWSLFQQFGRQAVNLLVFALLVWLLTPQEIGVLGGATVWMTFALVFADLGFGAALIQRPSIGQEHLSSVFALNLLSGVILGAIGLVLAFPFAQLLGIPESAGVLRTLSAVFVTDTLAITQVAMAQRELRFRALAIRDIASSVIGGTVGAGLAFAGAGPWSVVGLAVGTSVAGLLLVWGLSSWRPRLRDVSRSAIRELWWYSSQIFAFGVLKQGLQNMDKLIVGATLGPVALGVYTFAYRLIIAPTTSLSGAVGAFLFPEFARLQEDPRQVRHTYLLVVRTLLSVVLPVLAIVALVAPILIPGIFGTDWTPAVPLVQLFAIVAVLQTIISPSGQLMKALNRPNWLLAWSIGFALITVLAIGIGSRWNTIGMGLGLVIAHVIGIPIIFQINWRLINVSLLMMCKALLPASLASVALSIWIWGVVQIGMPHAMWSAALGVSAGMLIYLGLLARLDYPLLVTLLKGLRSV